MSILLTIHLAVTLLMTGLIWMVQVVHYPLFADVGAGQFGRYEAMHSRRISRLVAPLMVMELITGILLVVRPTDLGGPTAAWLGLILILVIWLSTFFLQVPQHARLQHGFDPAAHRRLVQTNWIRTVAWTLRACLLLIVVHTRAGYPLG